STFYSLDIQAAYEWTELGVGAPVNWGIGNLTSINMYDLSRDGWLTHTYRILHGFSELPDGSANQGMIVYGDTHDYLVQISDTGTPAASPTFTLNFKERPHLSMTPAMGTPFTHDDNIAANGVMYAFAKGTTQYAFDTVETPDGATDLALETVDRFEGSVDLSDAN